MYLIMVVGNSVRGIYLAESQRDGYEIVAELRDIYNRRMEIFTNPLEFEDVRQYRCGRLRDQGYLPLA